MGAILKKIRKTASSKKNNSSKGNFEVKILTKQELDKRRCHAYKLLIP